MDKKTKTVLTVGGIGLAALLVYSALQPKDQGFTFTGGGGLSDLVPSSVITPEGGGGGGDINYIFPDIPAPVFSTMPISSSQQPVYSKKASIIEASRTGSWGIQDPSYRPDYPILDVHVPRDVITKGPEWERAPTQKPQTKKEERLSQHERLLKGQKVAWDMGKAFIKPFSFFQTIKPIFSWL